MTRISHVAKPIAVAGAVALAAAIAPFAPGPMAQAVAQTAAPDALPPKSTVNLTAEHHHIIKEIIIKEMKVQPPAQGQVPAQVGAEVPAGVPLQPIPVEVSAKIPALKSHSFIVQDGAVLIVDPKDNRIAERVD